MKKTVIEIVQNGLIIYKKEIDLHDFMRTSPCRIEMGDGKYGELMVKIRSPVRVRGEYKNGK